MTCRCQSGTGPPHVYRMRGQSCQVFWTAGRTIELQQAHVAGHTLQALFPLVVADSVHHGVRMELRTRNTRSVDPGSAVLQPHLGQLADGGRRCRRWRVRSPGCSPGGRSSRSCEGSDARRQRVRLLSRSRGPAHRARSSAAVVRGARWHATHPILSGHTTRNCRSHGSGQGRPCSPHVSADTACLSSLPLFWPDAQLLWCVPEGGSYERMTMVGPQCLSPCKPICRCLTHVTVHTLAGSSNRGSQCKNTPT